MEKVRVLICVGDEKGMECLLSEEEIAAEEKAGKKVIKMETGTGIPNPNLGVPAGKGKAAVVYTTAKEKEAAAKKKAAEEAAAKVVAEEKAKFDAVVAAEVAKQKAAEPVVEKKTPEETAKPDSVKPEPVEQVKETAASEPAKTEPVAPVLKTEPIKETLKETAESAKPESEPTKEVAPETPKKTESRIPWGWLGFGAVAGIIFLALFGIFQGLKSCDDGAVSPPPVTTTAPPVTTTAPSATTVPPVTTQPPVTQAIPTNQEMINFLAKVWYQGIGLEEMIYDIRIKYPLANPDLKPYDGAKHIVVRTTAGMFYVSWHSEGAKKVPDLKVWDTVNDRPVL